MGHRWIEGPRPMRQRDAERWLDRAMWFVVGWTTALVAIGFLVGEV